MTAISLQTVRQTLSPYWSFLSDAQCQRIQIYISLLLRWNTKVSLTTVTDIRKILQFHFGESMFGITAGMVKNGRLADVGSGAGFPGLVIALMLPSVNVTLLEPNVKKCVFLAEVARELQLGNIEIARQRIQDFNAGPFQFVASRALALRKEITDWACENMHPSGRILFWVGANVEIARWESKFEWSIPILIPQSTNRYIVIGKKR